MVRYRVLHRRLSTDEWRRVTEWATNTRGTRSMDTARSWNRCPLHGVGTDVTERKRWFCRAGGGSSAVRFIGSIAISVIGAAAATSCSSDGSSSATSMSTPSAASTVPPPASVATPESTAPNPIRVEGRGYTPVSVGQPIDVADLSGRIVFDDFEDVFTMRPDGNDVVSLTSREGSEFDGVVPGRTVRGVPRFVSHQRGRRLSTSCRRRNR